MSGRRPEFAMVPTAYLEQAQDVGHGPLRLWARLDAKAGDSGIVHASYEEMAAWMNLSVRQVGRLLRKLLDVGWLTVERAPAGHGKGRYRVVNPSRRRPDRSVHATEEPEGGEPTPAEATDLSRGPDKSVPSPDTSVHQDPVGATEARTRAPAREQPEQSEEHTHPRQDPPSARPADEHDRSAERGWTEADIALVCEMFTTEDGETPVPEEPPGPAQARRVLDDAKAGKLPAAKGRRR